MGGEMHSRRGAEDSAERVHCLGASFNGGDAFAQENKRWAAKAREVRRKLRPFATGNATKSDWNRAMTEGLQRLSVAIAAWSPPPTAWPPSSTASRDRALVQAGVAIWPGLLPEAPPRPVTPEIRNILLAYGIAGVRIQALNANRFLLMPTLLNAMGELPAGTETDIHRQIARRRVAEDVAFHGPGAPSETQGVGEENKIRELLRQACKRGLTEITDPLLFDNLDDGDSQRRLDIDMDGIIFSSSGLRLRWCSGGKGHWYFADYHEQSACRMHQKDGRNERAHARRREKRARLRRSMPSS
jgi:hypothetical protein